MASTEFAARRYFREGLSPFDSAPAQFSPEELNFNIPS